MVLLPLDLDHVFGVGVRVGVVGIILTKGNKKCAMAHLIGKDTQISMPSAPIAYAENLQDP